MPRPAKGVRLWLRPEERNFDGSLRKRAVWVIRDGPRKISTGCAAEDREDAERALGEHLANKYQPNRTRGRHPSEILIADVLAIYLIDVAPRHARENETKQRVLTLDAWWGDRTLADVSGGNCRAYVAHRVAQAWKAAKPDQTGKPPRMVTAGAARRELEDLRAAINHHRREGLCSEIVSVVLPPRPPARERWLTRSEAARLLWAAWRAKQVMRDNDTRRAVGRHVARFILVGLYTGTRSSAICRAALTPTIGRGHVELEQGVFYRRAIGRRQTKKRQPQSGSRCGCLRICAAGRDTGSRKNLWLSGMGRRWKACVRASRQLCARPGSARADATRSATHLRHLADAEGRQSVGRGWLPGHDGAAAGAGLRAPPPRLSGGCRRGVRGPAWGTKHREQRATDA